MSHHLGNIPEGEWGTLHDVPEAELENAYMRASLQVTVAILGLFTYDGHIHTFYIISGISSDP